MVLSSVPTREISFSAPNFSRTAPSHTQSERGRPPTYQFVMNVNSMSWSYMLKQAGVLNQQLPELKRKYLVSPTKSTAHLELSPPNPSPVLKKHRITIDSQNLSPKLSPYRWTRTEQKYTEQPQATDRPYRHSHQFSDWMIKTAEPTVHDPVSPRPSNKTINKSDHKNNISINTPPVINQHLEKIYDKLHTSKVQDKSILIKKLNKSLPMKQTRDIPTIKPYFYSRLQQAVQPELILPRGYSYSFNQNSEFDDPVYSSNGNRPLVSENVRYRPAANQKTDSKLEKVYLKPTCNRHFRSSRQAYKSAETYNKIVTSRSQNQTKSDSENSPSPHRQTVIKGEARPLLPTPDLVSKSGTFIAEKERKPQYDGVQKEETSVSIPPGNRKSSDVDVEAGTDEEEEVCYKGLHSVTITPKPQSRPDTCRAASHSRPNTRSTIHVIEQE